MLGLAALIFFGACAFLRISSTSDLEAYAGMASECHPVWKLFALRRFGPGDSVERLFRKFPPSRRQEFGRYGLYSFNTSPSGISFTGFGIITKDGKLLSAGAGSCTWRFTFFNTPDAEFNRQYAAFVQERHVKVTSQQLEQFALHLQRFYVENRRWPTNEGEFAVFFTGKTPTAADLDPKLTGRAFRHRYHLDEAREDSVLTGEDIPADNLASYNPFGITIAADPDQRACIAYTNKPGLASLVQKPQP